MLDLKIKFSWLKNYVGIAEWLLCTSSCLETGFSRWWLIHVPYSSDVDGLNMGVILCWKKAVSNITVWLICLNLQRSLTLKFPSGTGGRDCTIWWKRRLLNVLSVAYWTSQLHDWSHGKARVDVHECAYRTTRDDLSFHVCILAWALLCLSLTKGNAKAQYAG